MKTRHRQKPSVNLGLRGQLETLCGSVWLFPVVLTLLLLLLTCLQIHGSSLSIYNYILGVPQGKSLILNEPQAVRSDEWIVNTQLTIAQKNNNYERINKNLGNGEDVSMSNAVPYKDWSAVFRPHNLAYFVLPFDNAFAFSWWLMGYLLVLGCYFFVLCFLPNKRLWAALISIALFFSPFVQWWYLYGTLGSIYYPLLIGLAFVGIMRTTKTWKRITLAACLAYLGIAFALVLYPPFMIACAFGLALALLGYLLNLRRELTSRELIIRLSFVAVALMISLSGLMLFLETREEVVNTMTSTVYPGRRAAPGGGMDFVQVFSGFMNTQLQHPLRAKDYGLNQSAASNFLLVAPFLLIPAVCLVMLQYRKRKPIDWLLIASCIAFVLLLIRSMSTILDPALNTVFKMAPLPQLIIGLGFLNTLLLTFFIRTYRQANIRLPHLAVGIYALLVLCFELLVAFLTRHNSPDYINIVEAIALSLPIPLVVYFLLRQKYTFALSLFALFSIFSSFAVNPLYHTTRPLSEASIVKTIQAIGQNSNGKWISESIHFENFPLLSGEPSLSGTYQYPQLSIWKDLPPRDPAIYNRYAHIIFVVDRQPDVEVQTYMELQQGDAFVVVTEPCSDFLKQNGVKYILGQSPINDSCVKLRTTVAYPNQTFFIYELL